MELVQRREQIIRRLRDSIQGHRRRRGGLVPQACEAYANLGQEVAFLPGGDVGIEAGRNLLSGNLIGVAPLPILRLTGALPHQVGTPAGEHG